MGSQNEKCEVGFIGLGSMGFPMAENILKKGFSLCIYNRTKEKALPLLSQVLKWTPSPSEMAAGCNIVVSMVANDEALRDIVDGEKGLLRSSEKPSIHISMSTVSPRLSAELEEKHSAQGVIFLSAPVTGRPERAREGALWIFLAGNSDGKKKAAPVLEAMSCKIFDLGEHPSQASLFKLCNNFMILSFIESLSEAGALLEKEAFLFKKQRKCGGNPFFTLRFFIPMLPLWTSVIMKKGDLLLI